MVQYGISVSMHQKVIIGWGHGARTGGAPSTD